MAVGQTTRPNESSIEISAEAQEEEDNESLVLVILQTIIVYIVAFINYTFRCIWTLIKRVFRRPGLRKQDVRKARQEMSQAVTYKEWQSAAQKLDIALGKEEWKKEKDCMLYDAKLIEHRLHNLRKLSSMKDYNGLITAIREGMVRNLGGIGKNDLYEQCVIGTKQLVTQYTNEVVEQLRHLCDTEIEGLTLEKKFDMFYELRQSYGRSALLLSGGASLGMYHLGVIRALHEEGLLPKVISGSSVGSIAASFLCILKEDEIPKLFDMNIWNFEIFESHGSVRRKLVRFLKKGVLMDPKKLQEWLRKNFGDQTFKEAFERTGKILNIAVSSVTQYEVPRILNYLTAPNVLIWSAACASCALPYFFPPVELMAKDRNGKIVPYHPPGQKWSDGSVGADIPMTRLSELFNVNHFIVSQVNPHVAPFLYIRETQKGFFSALFYIMKSELKHRINQIQDLGMVPSFFGRIRPIVDQKYYGDITLVPRLTPMDLTRIMSNPTSDIMGEYMIKGQRMTWPKISMIKHHCTIEFTLEAILSKLRTEIKTKNVKEPHLYNTFSYSLQQSLVH